jgi:hypothetical protein
MLVVGVKQLLLSDETVLEQDVAELFHDVPFLVRVIET